jgi:hypothetical protein
MLTVNLWLIFSALFTGRSIAQADWRDRYSKLAALRLKPCDSRGLEAVMHPPIVMDAETGHLRVHEPRRGEQLLHMRNILSLTQRRRGNEYGICIQTTDEPETSLFVPLYRGIRRASYQQILEVDRVRTLIETESQRHQ